MRLLTETKITPKTYPLVDQSVWVNMLCGSVSLKKGRKKKMKVLEEFWYGNTNPTDRNLAPNGRIDQLLKLAANNEQQLSGMLSDREREMLQKIKDSQDELSSVTEWESFTLDFRLGARFMLEFIIANSWNVILSLCVPSSPRYC